MTAAAPTLHEVLDRARRLGFLGPGPVEPHIHHARAMATAVEPEIPATVLDLGSGGGLPGLVIALRWPSARVLLLDAIQKRTRFLGAAVEALGLSRRVRVMTARAEAAGRDPGLRGAFELVTARSFGPPPVTAECGSPFLALGGRLVVSEPPEPADRWPALAIAELGLVSEGRRVGDYSFAVLRQTAPCPDRYPRRTGVPAKRPLF